MTLNTEKLTQFAQAVGQDVKQIKLDVADKASTSAMTQAIAQAKTDVKAEILGEGVPEQLDTLKEIADRISNGGGSADQAIVSKLTELGQKFTDLENLDLVAEYTTAKA